MYSVTINSIQTQIRCRKYRTLSTLARVLADVSTYWTDHSSAFARASSADTCRLSSKSDLFPTTNRGTLSSSAFTLRICSLWTPRHNTFTSHTLTGRHFTFQVFSPRKLRPDQLISSTWLRVFSLIQNQILFVKSHNKHS